MHLKTLAFMALTLALSGNVEAREFFVFDCGATKIMFPIKTFPQGVSFTTREVCDCVRRGWRGPECDVKLRNKDLSWAINRKNDRIADKVLKGTYKDWR
jgi:hypothetical protein